MPILMAHLSFRDSSQDSIDSIRSMDHKQTYGFLAVYGWVDDFSVLLCGSSDGGEVSTLQIPDFKSEYLIWPILDEMLDQSSSQESLQYGCNKNNRLFYNETNLLRWLRKTNICVISDAGAVIKIRRMANLELCKGEGEGLSSILWVRDTSRATQ